MLTPSQLNALLELLPGTATLHDAQGAIVAQNQAAAAPASAPGSAPTSAMSLATPHLHSLGDGWQLRHVPHLAPSSPLSDEMTLLVRGMAHEIRNPLSAILTALDLVRDDPGLAEESTMLLGIVRKEARRMNHILTEFSAYVKPQPPCPIAFDLAQTTRRVAAQLRRGQVLPDEVQIEDTLPSQLPAWADEGQIAQALSRVLQNAVDAMEHGGVLRLSCEQSEMDGHPAVTLCLEDSGPGFSSEALERAFQPFYSTKPHDTGLGLSIARSAVEAAGGRMWLDNAQPAPPTPNNAMPGRRSGARVCLQLPLQGSKQLPETPHQA